MSRSNDWIKLLAVVLFAGAVALPSRGAQNAVRPAAASAEGAPETPAPEPAVIRTPRAAAAHCIIAIVPDPVDSDARWMFDPLIDAISTAAAHENFSLLDYELPDWDATRSDVKAGGREHETTPGWIAFARPALSERRAAKSDERLTVYLVYETATAGIHEQAMKAALTEVRSAAACEPASPTRILGPTFSGSVLSLRRALDGEHGVASPLSKTGQETTDVHFRVVTGSATSATNADVLKGPGIEFGSAVLSDATVVGRLLDFVSSRYGSAPRVALLVESTPYGNALADLDAVKNARYQLLRFPLHISRLRSGEAPPPPIDGRGGQVRMPLTLGERAQATDRFPVMTAATTGPAAELMLHNILEGIRRTRVDAVGLFATDTRDKLFLAQEISRAIPGILLFTTEADILYTHPQYQGAVRGMVVAATYPMVPGESIAGKFPYSTHSFSNSSALGTFNAMLTLLHDRGSPPDLLEYASRSADTPPIWLSVTTADGLWPIDYVRVDQQYSALADGARGLRPPVRASAWSWAACLLVFLLAVGHYAAQRWIFSRGQLVTIGRLTWDPPARPRHLVHLWVSLFALIVIAGVFGFMWSAGAQTMEEWAAVVLQGLAGVAIVGAMVGMARSTPSRLTRQTRSEMLAWAAGLLLGTCLLIAIGAYARDIGSRDADLHLLFFDRSAHPSSGASPVFALVAVVLPVYLWGLVHVIGANKNPDSRLFEVVRGNGAGADPDGWVRAFTEATVRPLTAAPRLSVLLAVAGVIASGVLMWLQGLATAESPAFTWGVASAWLLAQLLLSLGLVETLVVWMRFRHLLRSLAAHPLVLSYTRVPAHMLGDRLSPRRPRLRDLAPLVHARTLLAAPLGPLPADVADTRAPAVEAMRELSTRACPFDADMATHRAGWTKCATFAGLAADAATVRVALTSWWSGRLAARDEALAAWCGRAEEFLGMFVVLFVRETLARVTTSLFFMLIAVLLLVGAQSTFSFHPRQVLLAMTWCYAAVTIVAAFAVFITVERDVVLARLASTPEGRVVWDRVFLTKLLIYALIPLATLFAAQFPSVGDTVQQWLTPVQATLP